MTAPSRSWGDEPGEHTCPGCAEPGVPNRWYACESCWGRLPTALQRDVIDTAVNATWERRMAVLTAAAVFFTRHPAPR